MKIYTEVNYIWKDDKLVQTDSKSFDYEGEVEQCHTKKFFGMNQPHTHYSLDDAKKDVGNIATGNVGEIIDRNTDSIPSTITDPIREETDRITAAHHTNLKYMRAAAMGLMGFPGGLPDTTMYYNTTNDLTGNEAGSRGTASGGATGATGKSTSATRVIREKNKPVASMITQQKKLGRK